MIALLRTLFRLQPGNVIVAIMAGVISGACAAGMAVLVSRALSAAVRDLPMALAFFGTVLAYFILRILAETRLIRLTQSAVLQMRLTLGHKLLATPQRKLQELGRQPVLTILTRDIDAFAGSVQLIPIILGNLCLIAGCFAYLAWENWRICLVILACLILGSLAFRWAERSPLLQLARLRDKIDTLYIKQRALVEGSKELQLNRARGTDYVDNVIGPAASEVARDFVGAMSSYIWVTNLGNSLFYLVIGAVLFGFGATTSTQLLPIVLLLLYLIKPVSEVLICLPPLRQSAIALQRIEQLGAGLATPHHAALQPLPAPQTLTLQAVTHSYGRDNEDGTFTLGPIDLALSRGEVLFLVGGNGSGKTTLAMLICGLYPPETGQVLLDGTPITDANRASHRQLFAGVFSDFHLFEELPGRDDPDMEARARHYIKHLRMDHKVGVSSGKLTTTDLSLGQRKRLALVSAYLEDRPIYLFDEWAADQDPQFKAVFYTDLLPELKARGKSIVVISHDDAYFHCADRVVKLVDGQIEGNPA